MKYNAFHAAMMYSGLCVLSMLSAPASQAATLVTADYSIKPTDATDAKCLEARAQTIEGKLVYFNVLATCNVSNHSQRWRYSWYSDKPQQNVILRNVGLNKCLKFVPTVGFNMTLSDCTRLDPNQLFSTTLHSGQVGGSQMRQSLYRNDYVYCYDSRDLLVQTLATCIAAKNANAWYFFKRPAI